MPLAIGLLLQSFAVFAVVSGRRRSTHAHLGPLLLALMVAYHGIVELLSAVLPPSYSSDRFHAEWFLIVSACIAFFSSVYVIVLHAQPNDRKSRPQPPNIDLSWKFFAFGFGFLFFWAALNAEPSSAQYWRSGLSTQLMLPLAILGTSLFSRQAGRTGFYFALVLQSLALSLLGQRGQVLFGAIAVVLILVWLQVGIRGRDLVFVAVIGAVSLVAIGTVRTVDGRGVFSEGDEAIRINSLIAAVQRPQPISGLTQEAMWRLNANPFAAEVLDRLPRYGTLGFEPLLVDMRLVIPAVLWDGKHEQPDYLRNEEAFISARLGFSDIDYRSSLLALALSYGGPVTLLFLSALAGAGLAVADQMLGARVSNARLILYASALVGIMSYETGLTGWLIAIRASLLLLIALGPVRLIQLRTARP